MHWRQDSEAGQAIAQDTLLFSYLRPFWQGNPSHMGYAQSACPVNKILPNEFSGISDDAARIGEHFRRIDIDARRRAKFDFHDGFRARLDDVTGANIS